MMKIRKRTPWQVALGWPADIKKWCDHRWHNMKRWQRIVSASLAVIILLSAVIPTVQYIVVSRSYILSDQIRALVGTTEKNLAAKISYDKTTNSWVFNKGDIPVDGSKTGQARNDMPTPNMLQAKVGGSGKDSESLYSVQMPARADQGLTYYDKNTRLSFSLVPQFKMADGREVNGQLIYPAGRGIKAIYTAKANGMKEDIVLTKPIGDELSFAYDLKLPKDLRAKILDNGGLGVYSADPVLYGDYAFGDGQDIEKIKSARETAAKDHLLFEIPAPVIKQTGNGKMTAHAEFVLDGTTTLKVKARGMQSLHYPVTVDPSVTVTSSTDFGTGAADNNIDFTSGEVDRGKLTGGSVGTWSSTGSGSYSVHTAGTSVIYNGYIYYIGGDSTEVPYTTINSSTGALGTWSTTTSLPAVRRYPGVTAYNGYMYVYGGVVGSATTAASDILVASINSSTGALGSWSTASTAMATGACRFGMAVYNGYVYAVAGNYGTIASNCGNSSANHLATTQYAKMGAGGTIGTWSTSSSTLGTAVQSPGVVAYNGYLYSIGGTTDGTTALSSVSYARINPSTGDISSWTSSSWTMPNTNYRHSVTAYNGYVYVLGGNNNSTQVLYSQIKESGDISKWYVTTALSAGRYSAGFAAYNGYLYFMAGTSTSGGGSLNDTGYAKINPAGTLAPPASTNSFTTAVRGNAYVNYGNYSYVLGGEAGSTPVTTTYKAAQGNNGDLQSFSTTTVLPTGLSYFGAAAYQGYLYVVGGCTATYSSCNSSGNVATVYKSAINASDGTLGAWSTETSLTTARHGLQLVAYNGYLYAIGGLNNATFKNDIEYHAIGASGAISGSWSASAQTFTTARAHFGAAAYGGKLYIAGGCSAGAVITSCSTFQSDVQYATIGSSGDLSGAFTTNSNSFGTARSGTSLVIAYGNAYVVDGWDGSTYHSDAEIAALNSDGSIGTWTTTAATNNGRAWTGAVAVRGYLQVAGGYNGAYLNTVHFAYMNNGGAHRVFSWSSTGSTVSGWANGGGAIYRGFLYEAGGNVSGTPTANVKYASLNSDGTTTTWTAASTMNTARDNPTVYVAGGYLYVSGGTNASSTLQSSTEYAQINADGSLGSWSNATATLSTARAGGAYSSYGNTLYYIGGKDGSSDLTSVYYAPIGTNGGDFSSWTSTTSLPTALYRASAVAYNGYMYVLGGGASNGSSYSSKVYVAAINSGGSLGSWSATTSTPVSGYMSAVGYNGVMYITGSYNGSYSAVTYMTAINSSNTLGSWEQTPSQSSVDNISGKSFGYQGYLYHLAAGGVVTSGAADSTARVGNYSKVVGLGAGYALTGISYTGDLPGGLVNIKYRTANTDGAFGSLNSSSSLIGAAVCPAMDVAYVLVLVRLDDSGSAVFPDSYSSAADVKDLTISYGGTRADTASRLAHGKSFQNESLQGLDTCAT